MPAVFFPRTFSSYLLHINCFECVKVFLSNYCLLLWLTFYSTSHLVMRPSLPRLVRVLPRSAIPVREHGHLPPARVYEELPKGSSRQPSLLEILLKEKEAAGANYPPNIRIEPVVSKKTFAGVKREFVAPLKAVLRER
jgi:hypothetical protein